MNTSNAAVCIVCRETLTVDCMPGLFGPGFTCRRCGEKTRRNLSNVDAAVARAAEATSKAAAALGRLGGKAGRGESQRRGDSDHYRAIRAQRVTIYGYRNVAYYPGPRAEGYAVYYPTGAARDEALATLRSEAAAHGLARSAAQAGIYAVTMSMRDLTDEQRDELAAEGHVRID